MSLIRVSEKKLAANRANAQKSRGPSTPQGKERSSRNACKHHLYARKFCIHPAWEARIWDVVNPAAACIEDPAERAALVAYFFLKQWRLELYSYETRLMNESIARHRSVNRGIHDFVTTNSLFHAIENRVHIVHRQAERARITQTTPNVTETKPLTMAAAASSSAASTHSPASTTHPAPASTTHPASASTTHPAPASTTHSAPETGDGLQLQIERGFNLPPNRNWLTVPAFGPPRTSHPRPNLINSKPLMGRILAILLPLLLAATALHSQIPTQTYQSLHWRNIGPHRAGRTVGATGIPTDPNTFYIGVNNGGVWKTTDAGRTWNPIFDQQPTGSIGDIAVAWSNPDVLYAGSGEGLQRPDLSTGDGIYKSTDAGKTWRNTGLHDAQQIGGLIVDPTDPDRVFVAALGHPYGPNQERGVFRTEDGGDTWQRVLYIDENTGAIQVEFEPGNPNVIYADLWAARQGARENDATQFPGSGLYKSTDGGKTWRHLTNGLPTTAQGLGRIGFGISASRPKTLYATVEAPDAFGGIYRSDDAGESWHKTTNEARTWGRGSDFAEIRVHPKDAETVYVANTASYLSTDGAKTFRAFKGAPGGDDYHRIWINPAHPEIMLFATDQGATITVNAGLTWSSWYNQPTAQFYHVSTDNQWPYWVYGGQQESGSAGVASRGDYGAITWRDWRTVGVEEYGYVAPDPLDPNIIYGGKITRFDKRTGQVQNIAPKAPNEAATGRRPGKYRFLRTAPVLFSPIDPRRLYYAGNVLFMTLTGGQSWSVISPEFSDKGVIYTVAPSHQDVNTIWAGTDDGTIHLTRDNGKTWQNTTPPGLKPWSKISLLEASHFDNQSAYAAINTLRLDDLRPHILRTHDAGKTWTEITTGIPANENVNAVREDPKRKGLLYAATERAVYFSLDDGAHWNPLRQNMPATSIRDIVLHDDDLVAGTHGRGFWILDGVSVLRQITAEKTTLYRPALATRVRRSANTDTPIPPEEPMGQNPPDGAIIDYSLADATPVTLEILDAKGRQVRKYASTDVPEKLDETKLPYPSYWFRPASILPATPGHHRWIWDLRYAPPEGFPRTFPISAIYRDTPSEPQGPLALPGEYIVRLTANGQTQTQKLTLRQDPRSVYQPTNHALRAYDLLIRAQSIQSARPTPSPQPINRPFVGGRAPSPARDPLVAPKINLPQQLLSLMETFDASDAPPTAQAITALATLEAQLK